MKRTAKGCNMLHDPTVTHATTRYRTVVVQDLKIFYREAGRPKAPHGVRCSLFSTSQAYMPPA